MTATFDLDVPVNLTVDPTGLTPVINADRRQQRHGHQQPAPQGEARRLSPPRSAASSAAWSASSSPAASRPINLNSSLASLGPRAHHPRHRDGQGLAGPPQAHARAPTTTSASSPPSRSRGHAARRGPCRRRRSATNAEVTRKTVDPAGLKLMTLTPRQRARGRAARRVRPSTTGRRAVEYQYKVDHGFWHPFTSARASSPCATTGCASRAATPSTCARASSATRRASTDAAAEVEVVDRRRAAGDRRSARSTRAWSASTSATWSPATRWSATGSTQGRVETGTGARVPPRAPSRSARRPRSPSRPRTARATSAPPRRRSCAAASTGWPDRAAAASPPAASAATRPRRPRAARHRPRRPRRPPLPPAPGRAGRVRARRRARSGRLGRPRARRSPPSPSPRPWAGCSCGATDEPTSGTTRHAAAAAAATPATCMRSSARPHRRVHLGRGDRRRHLGRRLLRGRLGQRSNRTAISSSASGTARRSTGSQVDGVPTTPPGRHQHVRRPRASAAARPRPATTSASGPRSPSAATATRPSPTTTAPTRPSSSRSSTARQWAVQTVDRRPNGDVGRYAKMLFLNGNFVIAYQSIAPGGTNGALISKVRVATSTSATPTAGGWTFEDAAIVDTTPCRAVVLRRAPRPASPRPRQCTATVDAQVQPGLRRHRPGLRRQHGEPGLRDHLRRRPSSTRTPTPSATTSRSRPTARAASASPTTTAPTATSMIAPERGRRRGPPRWSTARAPPPPAPSGDCRHRRDPLHRHERRLAHHLRQRLHRGPPVREGRRRHDGRARPRSSTTGSASAGTPFADGQHLVGDDSHLIGAPERRGPRHLPGRDAPARCTTRSACRAPRRATPGRSRRSRRTASPARSRASPSSNGALQLVNWWRVGGTTVQGDVRVLAPQ